MGSMRNWVNRLNEKDDSQSEPGDRIVVVHCKAGKGRSGTIACSYLISQEGWKKEDALQRFTERRMRGGFGAGVSIPSQLRYVGYVDRWTNELQKQYIERPVEIMELHIWGLRDGVKVVVQGFEDEGKRIKNFHKFHRRERTVVEAGQPATFKRDSKQEKSAAKASGSPSDSSTQPDISRQSSTTTPTSTNTESNLEAIIYRPREPLIVSGSDVNIDFERRSKVSYTGLALVTSLAHVWFNAYFEGGNEHDSGVFEIQWDAMDGIKGSYRKGIRALERLKVVWRYPPQSGVLQGQDSRASVSTGRPVSEPQPGEPIHESQPADWRGAKDDSSKDQEQENRSPSTDIKTAEPGASKDQSVSGSAGFGIVPALTETVHSVERQLGLRVQTDGSKDVSLAGTEDELHSTTDDEGRGQNDKGHASDSDASLKGVRTYFGKDEERDAQGKST